MQTYIVKDTTIKHGRGKEPAKYYNPGDEIELTEEEAQGLSVEPKKGKKSAGNADAGDLESMSKKEIRNALIDEYGITAPDNANKDALIALLADARGANPAE